MQQNPKNKPTIIDFTTYKYIQISGKGDPNSESFSERIGVLMSVAYPIKMNFKKHVKSMLEDKSNYPFGDYTVYALEGLWSSQDIDVTNKDAYEYTIMVRQPNFITEDMFNIALEQVKIKKPNELLSEISFTEISDGLSVQMLHTGSYDSEPITFEIMKEIIEKKDYERTNSNLHREIYLTDARKTKPEKLKTLLRFSISKG